MFFYSDIHTESLFPVPFDKTILRNDTDAYNKFEQHRFVYNKHFVAKSQGLLCGKMNEEPEKYPVFVKPLISLKGGNVGCYKIDSRKEFMRYSNNTDSFWSEYIEGTEGSTDFVIQNGEILFELSYTMEKMPDSIIQVITKISPQNQCPSKIKEWVRTHLHDFTGYVNAQYIGETIIEVGLRPDAGGKFIQWANPIFVERINMFQQTGKWIPLSSQEKNFKDVYNVACYKSNPIIYFIPAPILQWIMYNHNIDKYSFYIDNSTEGIIFFNIVSQDLEKALRVKTVIETLMSFLNNFLMFGILSISTLYIIILVRGQTKHINVNLINGLFIGWIIMYSTQLINPPKYMRYLYNRYNIFHTI